MTGIRSCVCNHQAFSYNHKCVVLPLRYFLTEGVVLGNPLPPHYAVGGGFQKLSYCSDILRGLLIHTIIRIRLKKVVLRFQNFGQMFKVDFADTCTLDRFIKLNTLESSLLIKCKSQFLFLFLQLCSLLPWLSCLNFHRHSFPAKAAIWKRLWNRTN